MSAPAEERGRVLVVEDDTVSRLVLTHMVRKLGYEVSDAADLVTARRLAGSVRPHVVLSDYYLPDGTGLDLLTQLRADALETPFVFITGVAENAAFGSLPEDEKRGVLAALTKPVNSRALGACLAQVFTKPAA